MGRRGPPFGMGLDVESSGPGGASLGFWFLLKVVGMVTGRSGVNIVQAFTLRQGVRVTFGDDHDRLTTPSHPPLDPLTELRVSGPLSPWEWIPALGGGAPSGGMVSCLRRNDG